MHDVKTGKGITKQEFSFAKFLCTYASICIHIQPDILDAKVTAQEIAVDLRTGPRRNVIWGHWSGAQEHRGFSYRIHIINISILSTIMYN